MNAINTGFGIWSPVVWTLLFIGALGIGFWIWSAGRKDYKENSNQTKPFLAGNEEANPKDLHVRGSHLYWGMTAGLRGYYDRIQEWHTGILSDYVGWFIGVLAVVFIILALVK